MTTIHPETRLGYVSLAVRDLRHSLAFYTQIIGFKLQRETNSAAYLGAGAANLLRLVEEPQGRRLSGMAGLYHFAILVPSRLELARSIKQLLLSQMPLQGFADHLVSEAVYLADPDGNGIEIYRDRPRNQWPKQNGQLIMATDPLDVNDLLGELGNTPAEWTGLAPETRIGHIHLQVSDLEQSISFYRDVLGFDLVTRYGPGAAFLSAGGYHHHIGCNTWAGVGVRPAPADALGLRFFTIELPGRDSFQEYALRLAEASLATEERHQGLLVRDPSGNGLLLKVADER